MSRSLSPAGLCWTLISAMWAAAGQSWSSTHLVQCELDEPNWTWTQTWVWAWMPDYSLNWIKGSSAIQCLLMTSSPGRTQEPFGLESVLNLVGGQFVVDGSESFKPKSVEFSSLVFFECYFALRESKCISTLGHSSSIHNSFSVLFIHSAFLPWSLRSYISLQNLFASLASSS